MSDAEYVATIRKFRLFAQETWSLANKSSKTVPFKLTRTQLIVDEMYERLWDTYGFVRMNILKLRQGGITTYCTGRATHFVQTRPATALTLAHSDKLPIHWLRRCKMWRDQTDQECLPSIGGTNSNELYYDKLPSRYYVGTAAGGFPGMGDTINFLHLSECGSWDKPGVNVDPSTVLVDLKPAMPTGDSQGGTVQIRESTGKMVGDWWNRAWEAAKSDDSEFHNLFLPWYLQEEYRRTDLTGDILSLSDYEQRLVRVAKSVHGLDLDHAQLAWRRHEIIQDPFFGNVEEWSCRFPAYEEESFLSPGESLYTADMVRKARETESEPIWRGNIICSGHPSEAGFGENASGECLIFEEPDERYHYVLGADCQWGVKETADFDVLHVECLETGKLCAKVKGRFPLSVWAVKIAAMGFHYNTCPVAPERNAVAATGLMPVLIGNVADWRYPNVWIRTNDIKLKGHRPEDYGWYTNEHTKGELIAYSQAATMTSDLQWGDSVSVDQMATIIRHENNSLGAPTGMHDDDWMSRIITAYVAHRERARELLYAPEVDTRPKFYDMEARLRASWEDEG